MPAEADRVTAQVKRAEACLRQLASSVPLFGVSNKQPDTLDDWLAWLQQEVSAQRERVAKGETQRPAIQPEGAELHLHEHGAGAHL